MMKQLLQAQVMKMLHDVTTFCELKEMRDLAYRSVTWHCFWVNNDTALKQ